MTVLEIINQTTWIEIQEIKNRYPNFINFILKRYGNFETRYPSQIWKELFLSLIINNQAELAFAETLTRETTNSISSDKLGDITTTTASNQSNRVGQSTNSYRGYNVEGDYAKNNNNITNEITANNKNISINYFSYLAGINQNRFKDTWKGIISQFLQLVVTIYLFES